ncbi:MAG TPA: flagellin [bacterium]|nr:flagellin [bacterium]
MAITRIHTNMAALNASRQLGEVGGNLSKSIERLSSGLRINRAGDDAAGLVIANRLTSQVKGIHQAIGNAQDGQNLIAVAEGALEEVTTRLDRMRELAVQAANTGTNDMAARQAIQAEIFQSIDEINRIGNTTQFSSNLLLNGDFSIQSGIRPGQDEYGFQIDPSPIASTLGAGTSFLNIIKIQNGTAQIVAGEESGAIQTVNLGIRNQTDIAVSLAHWTSTVTIDGANATTATPLDNTYFQGVSLYSGDTIIFEGVLSDGIQRYAGSISVAAGYDMSDLISAINGAIVDAQNAYFGSASDVPSSYKITAVMGTGANAGRIVLRNTAQTFSEASITFTVVRTSGAGEMVGQAAGVTRGALGTGSILSGSGQIGNSLVSITGSTFDTGSFSISVSDVIGAQQRVTENTIQFRDNTGSLLDRTASLGAVGSAAVINGSFVNSVYQGGITLFNNSTITITGTDMDGSTFQGTYTLDTTLTATTDTAYNDFRFQSISGLIEEINYRTRSYTATSGTLNVDDGDITRFSLSQFTYTTASNFQLVDDVGRTGSQTAFTFTIVQDSTNHVTIQDDAELKQDGFAESATISINGGEGIRAESGQIVTLYGPASTSDGSTSPQVTIRLGTGLTAGTDRYETNAQEFVGYLNGGIGLTFQNGDQDVTFTDPTSKQLTVDFDAILDVTKSPTGTDTGVTVLLSTVNKSLNFQVGAFGGQTFQTSLGDLRASNLGFGAGSGRTVADIDVTTLSGATDALSIIDEALDQVNTTRSLLGASTNRLESTVASLSVTAENLTASESRLRDADIAAESTQFTLNQILMQAGVSVLAQANFQNQSLLSLLGG